MLLGCGMNWESKCHQAKGSGERFAPCAVVGQPAAQEDVPGMEDFSRCMSLELVLS